MKEVRLSWETMAGKSFPKRIVALSAESAAMLYKFGVWDRVVGVTAYYRQPKHLLQKARVSGFNVASLKKIIALRPDLIITFSDVQAEIAAQLIREGITVLATNQRTLREIEETMLLIGRIIGCEKKSAQVVAHWKKKIQPADPKTLSIRPKVYFEEWNDPLISGIRWVSELIETAGGIDLFPELKNERAARNRIIAMEEVVKRQPDIIIASWCGKKVDFNSMKRRSGWNEIPAIKNQQLYEINSSLILQPGPVLVEGYKKLLKIFEAFQKCTVIKSRNGFIA